jgi:hypothetical protein
VDCISRGQHIVESGVIGVMANAVLGTGERLRTLKFLFARPSTRRPKRGRSDAEYLIYRPNVYRLCVTWNSFITSALGTA